MHMLKHVTLCEAFYPQCCVHSCLVSCWDVWVEIAGEALAPVLADGEGLLKGRDGLLDQNVASGQGT